MKWTPGHFRGKLTVGVQKKGWYGGTAPFEAYLKDGPDCFLCLRRPFWLALQPPAHHAVTLNPSLPPRALPTPTPRSPAAPLPKPGVDAIAPSHPQRLPRTPAVLLLRSSLYPPPDRREPEGRAGAPVTLQCWAQGLAQSVCLWEG